MVITDLISVTIIIIHRSRPGHRSHYLYKTCVLNLIELPDKFKLHILHVRSISIKFPRRISFLFTYHAISFIQYTYI